MYIRLLIVFFLNSLLSFGQMMNSAGHFIFKAGTVEAHPLPFSLAFQKDKVFVETKFGYIVLPGSCESSPSFLKIINENAKEIYSKNFTQVINLTLSPDRSYCIFHDLKKIVKINLSTLEETEFFGSNVFAINNEGNVAYYNDDNSTLCLNYSSYIVNESIYKVLYFKKEVLFMSSKCIYSLMDGIIKKSYCIDEGRFFDWTSSGEDLFVSVKKQNEEEFIFQSYRTNDLLSFQKLDEKHFLRKGSGAHPLNHEPSLNKTVTLLGELIRDPLNFYSDTVYQPIGNSYSEIQYYGSPRYLHPGVDLLGDHLQDVHSVK